MIPDQQAQFEQVDAKRRDVMRMLSTQTVVKETDQNVLRSAQALLEDGFNLLLNEIQREK